MRISGTFRSADNKSNINYYVYAPDTIEEKDPAAILQISHGMCEYFERYKDLCGFLNRNNILVCGNDHLGHGDSEELGFFAHENGFNFLSDDLYTLNRLMKKTYPTVPYILMGHSMGSFIARHYTEKYPDSVDACIYMGSGGAIPISKLGIALIKMMIKIKGEKYKSKYFYNLVFEKYDSRIDNPKSKYAWLTRDENVVEEYEKDPKTHFIFTLSGFKDLITLLDTVNRKEWFYSFPKKLPVLLISGTEDPVGDYGKGVLQVYNRLISSGCENVELELIKGARHEVINEIEKEKTYDYLKHFILNVSKKKNRT